MADYAQVHIQVSKQTKQDWQEYVEEMGGDLSSLSELVRWSVNKEIHRAKNPQENSQDLQPVLDYLAEIRDEIGEMNNRLDSVERELREDPEIRDLANRLFTLLPSRGEVEDWVANPDLTIDSYPESFDVSIVTTDAEGRVRKVAEHEGDELAKSGLIEAYSRLLDEEEYRIREAIKMLRKETMHIGEVELNDRTRYYREE